MQTPIELPRTQTDSYTETAPKREKGVERKQEEEEAGKEEEDEPEPETTT